MKEVYIENSISKISKENLDASKKNEKIKNNKMVNYLYLILIIILIIIIIIFLFLYLSNKNKNKIICDNGLFLPEDDKAKCIKCSIENCNECIGTKLNNICNKCKPGLNPAYEDNKIISCSICNEGYYLINDECKEYSFRAKYKSDGGTIYLINPFISDISKIKEMIVDGKQVSPSNSYLFNDTQEHEVFMLLDITKYVDSLESLFYRIDKMISISFNPFFNTSNIINMVYMFSGCSSLTSINISNFDTSNVYFMSNMFSDCHSLISIYLSNFDTSNVTDMSSMFRGCYSLSSINLSNFDTSKVYYMNFMFSNCSSLTSINLSNFDTSGVTAMNSMFDNCFSLTSINLSNFNTSRVSDMSYMFYGCSRLSFINILNFSNSNDNIINLFDKHIPSSGTIITNLNFQNELNISYISRWNIIIS